MTTSAETHAHMKRIVTADVADSLYDKLSAVSNKLMLPVHFEKEMTILFGKVLDLRGRNEKRQFVDCLNRVCRKLGVNEKFDLYRAIGPGGLRLISHQITAAERCERNARREIAQSKRIIGDLMHNCTQNELRLGEGYSKIIEMDAEQTADRKKAHGGFARMFHDYVSSGRQDELPLLPLPRPRLITETEPQETESRQRLDEPSRRPRLVS